MYASDTRGFFFGREGVCWLCVREIYGSQGVGGGRGLVVYSSPFLRILIVWELDVCASRGSSA